MNTGHRPRGMVVIAVSTLAAAAAVATFAAMPSGATQYSVTPRQFAVLSAKVAKLQSQVAGLKKTTSALATVVATCVTYKTLGVGQFGAPPNEGYVYQNASGSHVTSALDAAPASSAPVFLLTTPSQCATLIGTFSNRTGMRSSAGERRSLEAARPALRSAFTVATTATR